jgi:transposase
MGKWGNEPRRKSGHTARPHLQHRACLRLIHERDEIIVQLRKRLEEVEAKLEKALALLKQNSSNSSRPPSSDLYRSKKPSAPSEKNRGGQPGHEGHFRSLKAIEEVDQVIPVKPTHCEHCQSVLNLQNLDVIFRHQVTELPLVKPIITEYQIYGTRCRECGKKTQAILPASVPTGLLGPNAQALIVSATGEYDLSTRKTCRLFGRWYGLELSPALVCKTEKTASEALAPAYRDAKRKLAQAKQANFDETGFSQVWKKNWLWVGTSPKVTVFQIEKHRSRKAFRKLAGKFKGIVSADRYSVYGNIPLKRRQVCWSHLIRDFRGFLDRGRRAKQLGQQLGLAGQAIFHSFHQMKQRKITFTEFQESVKPYQGLVHGLLAEGRLCPDEKTANTCDNLFNLEKALWTFVRVRGVEPTNNAAERALRRAVIHRKTSFGTQSNYGSRFRERVMTVVATLQQNQKDVLEYLKQAIQAQLVKVTPPPLFSSVLLE